MKRVIETHSAPAAIGPYSRAIESDGLVFCSGQIGLDLASGRLVEGGIEAETRRALDNIQAVLSAAALGFADVVKAAIFLADLKDFELVNKLYGDRFEGNFPARSTVQAAALPRGARVEIEVIARRSH